MIFFRVLMLLCFLHWSLIPAIAGAQEPAPEKLRVAVMNLAPTNDLSEVEAATLTNRLNTFMIETDAFIIVERERIDEILREHALAQTGCLDEECIIEVGELLSAQYLIIGEVGKLGETYTIDVRLVNTETGQAEVTYGENHKGEIDGLLDLLPMAADKLAGKEIDTPSNLRKILGWGGLLTAGAGAVVIFLTRGGGTTTIPTSLGKPPNPPTP